MNKYIKKISEEQIKNQNVVSIFGHIIKINQQVHDFQYMIIRSFLKKKNIPEAISIVKDVIFEKEQKLTKDESIRLIKFESVNIRKELFETLAILACIDGATDKEESGFIEDVLKTLGNNDDYKKSIASGENLAIRIRKNLKKTNSRQHSGKKSNANDNMFRISQKEYMESIKRCRDTAYNDFELIKPLCNETISATEIFVNKLRKEADKKCANEKEQYVADLLNDFSGKILKGILASAKDYKEQMLRKESALDDFTIVLVGRTKAGKSTLKAVLTGTGKDEIGKGKQRTTRVNYIYEWNHLRIIDTPGIDAGEDERQEDKAVAEKALSEADVVCYLSPTSEGVPKGTKEFVGEIVGANKPILLLLNYKDNIRDEDKFEDFLEDPEEWRSDKGENSIIGYYEPIRRFAEENGYQEMVSYYPVFLLAAIMAEEEKYSEYSKILRSHSGVDEFLAALKIIVVEQGTFLRSKTIIDDTIQICAEWQKKLGESLKKVKDALDALEENEKRTFRKIDLAKEKYLRNSVDAIRQEFGMLITQHAKRFAEENYNKKSGIDYAWQEYCDNLKFEEKLQNVIEIETSEFSNTIESIFEDLSVDMEFELKNADGLGNKVSLFPARELTRFVGNALGIGGSIVLVVLGASNPIGWILTGASVVIGVVSSFFKKKADRVKMAQDELYNKIKESVGKQADKTIESFNKNANKNIDIVVKKAKQVYLDLEKCLKQIINESNELQLCWQEQIDKMNLVFAERIISYIASDIPCEVLKVNRAFGEKIEIFVASDIFAEVSKLNGIIKEKIIVTRVNSRK